MLNLHVHKAESLQSFNDLSEHVGMDLCLPAEYLPQDSVASVLHIVDQYFLRPHIGKLIV